MNKKNVQILPVQKIVVILHPLSIVVGSPVSYPFRLEDQNVREKLRAVKSRQKSHERGIRHP